MKLAERPKLKAPFADNPPPGPFRPAFWRSPLRGPWLTSFLGTLLGPLVIVVAATGLISHDAYRPDVGMNATIDPAHDVGVLLHLPASGPDWLYALSQGLHVTIGLVAIPLLLAKLWSVIPRLFTWPAVRSPAMALERLSLLLLVGGALFEFTTGVLNIQNFYPWHFGFVLAHYYGAWVFFAAFVLHVTIKMPVVIRAYRERGWLKPLRDDLMHTRPEPAGAEPDSLVPVAPAAPTISRRGLIGLVGGGSLTLLIVNAGESIGGPFRRLALLAPRGRVWGSGPNDFQINRTASSVGVTPALAGPSWRVSVVGPGGRTVSLSRLQLLAMPQYTYSLPIACVEGWSTTQHWTGVRLADLGRLVGASANDAVLTVHSIQPHGPFRHASFAPSQWIGSRTLLALRVNGTDLSPDHGYPARIIAPDVPGVHCTKWVGRMEFST